METISFGKFEGEFGVLFPLYSVYLFGILAFIAYILVSGYYKIEGIKKIQISYVLIGAALYTIIVLTVNLILPRFGIFQFMALDSPSSLILLIFTALAIVKYHLFGIKLILTEILIGVMGIILVILPFLMETIQLKILTAGIFLLFCVIGYLLIRYTYRELKTKEILEEKVEERTKEIEKRKEELERILKAVVGRELRMIELKEEIKKKSEKIKELEEKLK